MVKADAPSKPRSMASTSLLPAHSTAPHAARAPTVPQSLPMGMKPKPGPPPPSVQPPPAAPVLTTAPQEGSDGQPQLTARERAIRVGSACRATDCASQSSITVYRRPLWECTRSRGRNNCTHITRACALQAMQQQKHTAMSEPGDSAPWGEPRPPASMAPSSSQEPAQGATHHPARKLPSAARRPAGFSAPPAPAFRGAASHDPLTVVHGLDDWGSAPARGGQALPEPPKELPAFLRACAAGGGPSTSQVMPRKERERGGCLC